MLLQNTQKFKRQCPRCIAPVCSYALCVTAWVDLYFFQVIFILRRKFNSWIFKSNFFIYWPFESPCELNYFKTTMWNSWKFPIGWIWLNFQLKKIESVFTFKWIFWNKENPVWITTFHVFLMQSYFSLFKVIVSKRNQSPADRHKIILSFIKL